MKYQRLHVLIVLMLMVTVRAMAQIGIGKPFFRNFSSVEYKGHNRNFDIECDSKGRVFVANFEGLLVYDGVQWTNYHTPGISRITALFKSADGTVWFGGNNVIGYVENTDSVSLRYVADDLSDSLRIGEVAHIFAADGEPRFTTSDHQLFSISKGKIRFIGPDAATRQNSFFNGMEVTDEINVPDRNFSVLSTTSYGVIAKSTDGTVLNILTTDDGLCSNSIKALAYDGKGTVWGATDNGIFSVFESTVIAHFGETDGLSGQVTSILSDQGRLFVGTLQGLFVLGESGRFSRIPEIELACWQLAKMPDGTVLAATTTGVFSIGTSARQVIPNHTLSLYPESGGQFLAGTTDGIMKCNPAGTLNIIDRTANVVKFRTDGNGCLWAVDINNTTYYRPSPDSHFARSSSKDYSVLFDYTDSQGHLWKTSRNGLGLESSSLSDSQRKWCRPLADYSIQAMDINRDGIAWIGGNFGLIRLNLPTMNSVGPYAPKLHIRSISSGTSDLHIAVSSDKFDPIGRPLFSYRLHDDGGWSSWTTDQTLDFNNLAPGSYQISLRMQDAFGNIDTSAPIHFTVPIPFFFRWYMLLFYIAVIVLLTYAFYRWRIYLAQQEKLRLEQVVEERTRDLKEAQDQLLRQEREATVGKLTKGLIDRILNPMNYINNFSHLSIGLAKDLSENLEDDEEKMTPDIYEDSIDVIGMLKTNLEKIQQHGLSTTRILKAMEELLKDRSRKLEMTDMASLCQQAIEVFRNYNGDFITQANVRVETDFATTELVSMINAQNMSRAVLSILSNSIYAIRKKVEKEPSGTYSPKVKVSVLGKSEDTTGRIVIYDNGIGIEESIIDKVFDPFFTTKPTAEAPGVGLYFTQQAVQDIGGTISIKSVKDSYTEVTINLPK